MRDKQQGVDLRLLFEEAKYCGRHEPPEGKIILNSRTKIMSIPANATLVGDQQTGYQLRGSVIGYRPGGLDQDPVVDTEPFNAIGLISLNFDREQTTMDHIIGSYTLLKN